MRQASSANPTVGVKILSPNSFANLTAIDHDRYVYPDSCMTDGQKFRLLDGTIEQRNSNRSYDWSIVTSVGPFDLGPRSAYPVWFAFVGGTSESNAQANADSAQAWFNNSVGVLEGPGGPAAAQLLDVSPNPFADRAVIRYQLRQAGRVRVSVVDITGRAVAGIRDRVEQAGRSEAVWEPRDLADGVYFIRVETPDDTRVARVLLAR